MTDRKKLSELTAREAIDEVFVWLSPEDLELFKEMQDEGRTRMAEMWTNKAYENQKRYRVELSEEPLLDVTGLLGDINERFPKEGE